MSGRTCSANLTVPWTQSPIFLLNDGVWGRRSLIIASLSLKACGLLGNYQSFGRRCCFRLQNKLWSLSCHVTPPHKAVYARHSACCLTHPTTHSRTFSYARVTHVSSWYPFHTCSDQPTSWKSRVLFSVRVKRKTCPVVQPASYSMRTGSGGGVVSPRQGGRGVKLTSHLDVVPRYVCSLTCAETSL